MDHERTSTHLLHPSLTHNASLLPRVLTHQRVLTHPTSSVPVTGYLLLLAAIEDYEVRSCGSDWGSVGKVPFAVFLAFSGRRREPIKLCFVEVDVVPATILGAEREMSVVPSSCRQGFCCWRQVGPVAFRIF